MSLLELIIRAWLRGLLEEHGRCKGSYINKSHPSKDEGTGKLESQSSLCNMKLGENIGLKSSFPQKVLLFIKPWGEGDLSNLESPDINW